MKQINLKTDWSDGRPRPSSYKIGRQCALAIALAMALTISALGGQVVDRVVTNVNGHVVLQSDWEQEVAFEALSNGRDPDSFTSAERNAALDRLVDQELLREQVRPAQSASPEQVNARVAEVRAEVRKFRPDSATDDGWHATLQRYGLTQQSLEKHLSDQIQLMKLVEDRLPALDTHRSAGGRELLPRSVAA